MDGNCNAVDLELAKQEQEKYQQIWQYPEYGKYSPAEEFSYTLFNMAGMFIGAKVLDFGSGCGRFDLGLHKNGFHVTPIDHVNALDEEVEKVLGKNFIKACLWEKFQARGDIGFCIDVMEHIPTEKVDDVLKNICSKVRRLIFNISFVHDEFGKKIGLPLHLTVESFSWWKDKLSKYGEVTQARDLFSSGLFALKCGGKSMLNVTEPEVVDNLVSCLNRGLPQLQLNPVLAGSEKNREVVVLAGGPSLNDYINEIKYKREKENAVLMVVNGTHDWALDHDLTPSCMVMVDGRELNKKFLTRPIKSCKYFIASKCHPAIFEALNGYDVYIWHAMSYPEAEAKILDEWYLKRWYPVIGGSTSVLRGLNVLKVCGYNKFHIYGLDSCYGSEHAYDQPENSGEKTLPVTVNGRAFQCSGWQYSQAQHFIEGMASYLKDMEIAVYGDGLIANIIKAGANKLEEIKLME